MSGVVFYADILGFSLMASTSGAKPALDALADVATLVSENHDLAKLLQRPVWRRKFGLSDSLLLLADDVVGACQAAAEIFFNLSFYNAFVGDTVLLRGAVTMGEVREVAPLFAETASANVVGVAVVEAVELEKAGKGPRLFVSSDVEKAIVGSSVAWLLDRSEQASAAELLWLLPTEGDDSNVLPLGDVCAKAVTYVSANHAHPKAGPHAIAYLQLVVRSLLRLRERDPQAVQQIISRSGIGRLNDRVELRPFLEGLTAP